MRISPPKLFKGSLSIITDCPQDTEGIKVSYQIFTPITRPYNGNFNMVTHPLNYSLK